MKNYDEFINEGIIQNAKDKKFNGADPKTIEVHLKGVGGTYSLQGIRTRIVHLLEDMLKDAKMAEKNHELAHFNISKVLSLADPKALGGVLLPYLNAHQEAIEELESMRKKGGSGPSRTIPKNLI